MTLPDGFTEAREAHERGECRPEDRCFFCPPHPWEPTPTEAEYRARLHAETLVSHTTERGAPICVHGRQLTICAQCVEAVEAAYRETLASTSEPAAPPSPDSEAQPTRPDEA